MNTVMMGAFRDELEKIALTRYEKEISAGNVGRSDVSPGVPNLPGPLGVMSKKLTREQLAAPAAVDPSSLARTRALKDKLYEAQAAHPHTQNIPEVFDVQKKFLPGMGPATAMGQVFAPPESGQFMRGVNRPFGALRSGLGTLPAVSSSPLEKLTQLPARKPVDSTLNHAVLQHELGEASEFGKDKIRPFASHLGPEPILRENLAMKGDPEAMKEMAKLRQLHPDDALMQKAIRQAGGTPDAPLALGGRQHKAVERILDRSASKLDPATRGRALQMSVGTSKPLGYAPDNVNQAVKKMLPTAMETINPLAKDPSVSNLKKALPGLKELWNNGKLLRNFVKKGSAIPDGLRNSFFDEINKIAASAPPPLPPKANPMADALFKGMQSAPKTDVMKQLVKKAKEKDAGAFDRFMGGAGGKASLPQRTTAPDVAKRAVTPRAGGAFQPAVVGYGGGSAPTAKKPIPSGPLNPGGMMG
jgi:hypothetical protein